MLCITKRIKYINFEMARGDRSKIPKIFDFVGIFRMGRMEKFIYFILD